MLGAGYSIDGVKGLGGLGGGDSVPKTVVLSPVEAAIAYYKANSPEAECSPERATALANMARNFSPVDIYIDGTKQLVSRWQIDPPKSCSPYLCYNQGVFISQDVSKDLNHDGWLSAFELALIQYTKKPDTSFSDLKNEVRSEMASHILAEANWRNDNGSLLSVSRLEVGIAALIGPATVRIFATTPETSQPTLKTDRIQ